ncbi:hypothetical protein AMTRI_Chr13g119350 [Amborella trichopoda]
MAGRSTLIKASLANTPIYFMSLFQIPASVSKRIQQLMRNFLWSGSAETKKFHLVSWNKICTHKKKEGLGIRDLRNQNWALLGKWWRLANHENQLWMQVIRSKYYISSQRWLPKTNYFSTGSGIWKTLVSLLPRFRSNICFHARGGNRVRFWEDLWIDCSSLKDRFPLLYSISNCKESMIVNEMTLSGNSRDWNPSFRRSLSDEELLQFSTLSSELHGVFLSLSGMDSMIWTPSASRRFTVASFYRVLVDGTNIVDLSNRVWDSIAPPRTQLFQWLATLGRPLTIDNLQKRGFQFPNRCIMCLKEEETISHMLLHCDFTYSIWSQLIQLFSLSWVLPPSIQALLA